MIELGKTQCLNVVKKVDFGVYLGTEEDKVLLPKKMVPEDIEAGDALTVFVYRDSSDRLIATTKTPKVQLGQLAVLKVSQVSKIGAFLDWGLEKDLFMPFKEIKRFIIYYRQIGINAVILNLAGNVVAFMPFGFFLPLVSEHKIKFFKVFITAFSLSLSIELIQLISKVGSCDVDDLILNTLGGILGYWCFCIYKNMNRAYKKSKEQGKR